MERKEKHRVGNMPPDNKMADTVFAVNTPEDEPNIMSDLTKYGQLATADCEQRVANPGNKKFENILHIVGHKGRFRIVLLLLTFFCGATVTVQNYTTVFTTTIPAHMEVTPIPSAFHHSSKMAPPPAKRMKPSYDTVTATQLILEDDDIPDDSDDERLSADGDDEYLPGSPDPNFDSGEDDLDDTTMEIDRLTSSGEGSSSGAGPLSSRTSETMRRTWHWVKKDLPEHVNPESKLTPRGLAEEGKTPLQMFYVLFNDDIWEKLTFESNRLRIESRRVKVVPITVQEMRTFIGICLYMSIVDLPFRRWYWSLNTRQDIVADSMTVNRFEEIFSLLHCNDNTMQKQKDEEGYDRLFKIRPIIARLNDNFRKNAERETHVSVDEQIIPFKGRHSLKIYMVKKPKKWGYKLWVLAGTSGYVHKFRFAGDNLSDDHPVNRVGDESVSRTPVRQSSRRGENTSSSMQSSDQTLNIGKSGEIVMLLTQIQPTGSYVYFDNFFASPDLLVALKEMGINATATLRGNRARGCPLLCMKDIKKKGSGAFDFRTDTDNSILICEWFDNKIVCVTSNVHSVEPTHKLKRWDGKAKKHIEIPCPQLIKSYNQNMGGVDKCDMLLALYRNCMKSKKWYKRILMHLTDLCVTNAWLLYRALKADNCSMQLATFKLQIARGLILANRASQGKEMPLEIPVRSLAAKDVLSDVRYDRVDHFPKRMNVKDGQRCKRHPCKRKSVYMCRKCCVYLCITSKDEPEDCFYLFHHE